MTEGTTALRQVKAFIRPERIEDVVRGLEDLGVCQMTIIDVFALGKGVDPQSFKYSSEFLEKYSKLAKLEIVCPHVRVEDILEVIVKKGHTGQTGDGYAFVTGVEKAVDVYSGLPMDAPESVT